MPIVQISKIQMRRGPLADLPISPSLDDGEFGFTTDTGQLFIGLDNLNIEVLTQNSALIATKDNQQGFIVSAPMPVTASPVTFQTANLQNFNVDLTGNTGVNAIINYFIYDYSSGHATNPIINGTIYIVWNTGMVGIPSFTDDAQITATAPADIGDFIWSPLVVTGPHVVLQYINNTGSTLIVYFRIDRPFTS